MLTACLGRRRRTTLVTMACYIGAMYAFYVVLQSLSTKAKIEEKLSTGDMIQKSMSVVPTESPLIQAQPNDLKKMAGNTREQMVKDFKERAANVKKVCNKLHIKNMKVEESQFVYLKDRNILYCKIAKVASTFWQRILYLASGENKNADLFSVNARQAYGVSNLHSTNNVDNITKVVQNTNSFLFVRDPFSRLFSGWLDKFYSTHSVFWRLVGREIIKVERHDASPQSLTCGHDVSFEEFVRFVSKKLMAGIPVDHHFSPTLAHCNVCDLEFKYIGKYETLEQDSKFIIEELGIADKIGRFSDFENRSVHDIIHDAADWVFSQKGSIASCMTFQCGLFRVWQRMASRGVISKRIKYPYSDAVQASLLTKQQFIKDLVGAQKNSDTNEIANNREEVLSEAFNSLSKDTFDKMLEAFGLDMDLFGYSRHPDFLDIPVPDNANEKYLLECPF